MKRYILVLLIFCFAAPFAGAQLWKMRRWEATAGAGPSFFFGDIGGYSQGENLLGLRDITYLQTRYNFNASLKYRLSRVTNLRLGMSYARLHATDERGSNEGRPFEVSTQIFEPALTAEYYFIKNRAESWYLFQKRRGRFLWSLLRSLDFYGFAGAGGVYFDASPNEAQRQEMLLHNMKDSGFALVIPGGLGAVLVYTPNINFGLELGGRYAFTDWLDAYHKEQYSRANDVYYFLNFTISYKMKTGPRGLPSFR